MVEGISVLGYPHTLLKSVVIGSEYVIFVKLHFLVHVILIRIMSCALVIIDEVSIGDSIY